MVHLKHLQKFTLNPKTTSLNPSLQKNSFLSPDNSPLKPNQRPIKSSKTPFTKKEGNNEEEAEALQTPSNPSKSSEASTQERSAGPPGGPPRLV